jgi:hypothetical protein
MVLFQAARKALGDCLCGTLAGRAGAPTGDVPNETDAGQEKGISAGLGNRAHARHFYVDVIEADVIAACRRKADDAELRQRGCRREIKGFKIPHCRVW